MRFHKWLILMLVITLTLFGCGKKEEQQTEKAPDWQTQYDLGMRFLSDGDWEQAIPAFLEAIQIDPRRTETYLSLADAYVSAGRPDKAMEVLENAPEDVEEPELLANKLQAVSENVSPGAENSGTLTDADGQEDAKPSKNTGPFDERDGYMKPEELKPDQEVMIEAVVDAVPSGGSPEEVLDLVPAGTNLSTQWNGYKIRIDAYEMTMSCAEYYGYVQWASELTNITNRIQVLNIEMRPENGIGYWISYQITEGGLNPVFDGEEEAPPILDDSAEIVAVGAEIGTQYISTITTCPCENWQWNGTMSEERTMETHITGLEMSREDLETNLEAYQRTTIDHQTETGRMVNGLRDGTFKFTAKSVLQEEYGDGEPYESEQEYEDENAYSLGEPTGISGTRYSDPAEVVW